VQERGLLDHLFRSPEALNAKVSTVMDGPFPLVDANEEVERVVPMLAAGSPAVLVQRDGAIIGVVTRADVLEYVAHHREN
jgi:cystathionine beta-synthase